MAVVRQSPCPLSIDSAQHSWQRCPKALDVGSACSSCQTRKGQPEGWPLNRYRYRGRLALLRSNSFRTQLGEKFCHQDLMVP